MAQSYVLAILNHPNKHRTEGRKLNRHFDDEYRERVRGYHTTAAYQKALRKRQALPARRAGEGQL